MVDTNLTGSPSSAEQWKKLKNWQPSNLQCRPWDQSQVTDRKGKKQTGPFRFENMPKSKDGKDKKEKKEAHVSIGSQPDPLLLFKTYAKQCEALGLIPSNTLKKALTKENPNKVTQLLILGDPEDDASQLLGPGGCGALVSAILGECNDHDSMKYNAFLSISIWKSNLGDHGAAAIARLLSKCDGNEYQLAYLELPDNNIGALGALALGRSLCCGMNKTLLTLNLDYNISLGNDGVSGLAKGLNMNTTLKELSLRFCGIREENAISDILSNAKTAIISLDLEGNLLGGKGFKDLCRGLDHNKTLQKINLSDNNFVPDSRSILDLECLGSILAQNKSITTISFLRNAIGRSGGIVLLEKLSMNKTITSLLVDVNIGSEIYDALSRMPVSEKKKKGGKKKKKKKK